MANKTEIKKAPSFLELLDSLIIAYRMINFRVEDASSSLIFMMYTPGERLETFSSFELNSV